MTGALTRRRWLALGASSTALAGAWATGLVGLAAGGGCKRGGEPRALAFLTEAEYATTAAACERLLPRDDDPGAIDLGVPDYIDRALATDQARLGERFRAALRALGAEARRRAGVPFAQLSAASQDNLLDDWSDGAPDRAAAVALILTLTLEGAFGDPSHGGNRDARGWQLIGFAPCEPRHHTG